MTEAGSASWVRLSLILAAALVLTLACGGKSTLSTQKEPASGSDKSGSVSTLSQPHEYLKDPDEPPYDGQKGWSADGRRMVVLANLHLSIYDYKLANGKYPDSLGQLFPRFAPNDENSKPLTGPPIDPITREAYAYQRRPMGRTTHCR